MKKCVCLVVVTLMIMFMFSLEVGASNVPYNNANPLVTKDIQEKVPILTNGSSPFQTSANDGLLTGAQVQTTEKADTEVDTETGEETGKEATQTIPSILSDKNNTLESVRLLLEETREKTLTASYAGSANAPLKEIQIPAQIRTQGENGNERLLDAMVLSNGDFLLVGTTEIQENTMAGSGSLVQVAWVLRFSRNGELLWELTYHNKESSGFFTTAQELSDGSILLHYVNNLFNMRSHFLITVSADGEVINEASMSSRVFSVCHTGDGIIVDSGAGLTRYDENLEVVYEMEDSRLESIIFSTTDGIYFSGYTLEEGNTLGDAVAFQMSDEGEIVWEVVAQSNAQFERSAIAENGDFIGSGFMENDEGTESGMAVYIEADGTVRYAKEYGANGRYFFLSDVLPVEGGALLVGGSNGGNIITVILVDDQGEEIQRFFIELGKKYALTSSAIIWIATGDQIYLVGDLIHYRSLLQPEDTDLFVIPVNIPLPGM